MNKETYKFLEDIFGRNKVYYYIEEIDEALNCRGKYKDCHGMIHSGIVLYINSQGEDFISKASIYATLEALITGKDKIDVSDVLLPASPIDILKLAKRFIDEFNTKFMEGYHGTI